MKLNLIRLMLATVASPKNADCPTTAIQGLAGYYITVFLPIAPYYTKDHDLSDHTVVSMSHIIDHCSLFTGH